MAIEIYVFKVKRTAKDICKLMDKITEAVKADRQESLNIDGFYFIPCDDNSQNHVDKLQPDAYWCKANHIHRWISRNVLGNENGTEQYNTGEVTKDKLCKLAEQCKDVLTHCKTPSGENKIDEDYCRKVFPPFEDIMFGGSTEYDEFFLAEIEDTLRQVNNLLRSTNFSKYGLLCFVYA